MIYADSPRTDLRKEELARSIAERDGINEGIVCLISAIQPCRSFQVSKYAQTGRLQIRSRERKCLHHYLYLIDPEFGFMHVRIQGWMPWEIQIYVNGREWLARQLDAAGVNYLRHDNALLRIDDLETAGRLCEHFVHKAWPRVLDAFAKRTNPVLPKIREANYGSYYWVLDQAEVATDVMFKVRPALRAVFPDLVRHASLGPVLRRRPRLLGPKAPSDSGPRGGHRRQATPRGLAGHAPHGAELDQDVRQGLGPSGRDRHQQTERVPGPARGHHHDRPARAAVVPDEKRSVGLWRTFQVGAAANHRYLDAMAAAPLKGKGVEALDALCRPRTKNGRTYARFSPLTKGDLTLFRAALAGEHAIGGFRNRDLMRRLYPSAPVDPDDAHRRCERMSRLIVKLRGHGLVAKLPHARRYRVTAYGHRVMSAALYVHDHEFPAQFVAAA